MKLLVLVTLCALAARAHADDGDRWNGATMALQAGGGLAGLVTGGAIGGAIGYGLGQGNNRDSWAPLVATVLGAGIGGVTGLVVGVDLVGNARGSTGHWYGALGGALGGGAIVGALQFFQPTSNAVKKALAVAELVLLVAAPVVGYQLTADAHADPPAVPLALFTF